MAVEDLSPEERATQELVTQLAATGNLHPLIALLREGAIGPEKARDALEVLADFDLNLLIQITLDSLISEFVDDPGIAHQPRRAVRGQGRTEG